MWKKYNFELLIPLMISAVLWLLSPLSCYTILKHRFSDLVLRLKPSIPEDKRVLLVEIDNKTRKKTGGVPEPRDFIADGLILLKEFRAGYALLDIEYAAETTPCLPDGEQSYKSSDLYLEQAAYFFGNAYFCVPVHGKNSQNKQTGGNYLTYALNKIALRDVEINTNKIQEALAIQPPILPVLQGGKGSGFINSGADNDGVLRRTDLIVRYGNKYLPQLVFAPFLDLLGQPKVIAFDGKIILKSARLPSHNIPDTQDSSQLQEPGIELPDSQEETTGQGSNDLIIPLDENNRLLINWGHKSFDESFDHLSYGELVFCRESEKSLITNLANMRDKGYLCSYQEGNDLVENYQTIEDILKEILASGPRHFSIPATAGSPDPGPETNTADTAQIDMYRQARADFFGVVEGLLFGPTEKELLKTVEEYLNSGKLTPKEKQFYREMKASLPEEFARTRQTFQDLERSRNLLETKIPGSICIIGDTFDSRGEGKSVTPFSKNYFNIGVQANILNTILNNRFLRTIPTLAVRLLATLLAVLMTLILHRFPPLPFFLIGLLFLTVLMTGCIGFAINTDFSFELLTPFLTILLTLITIPLVKLLWHEKEKSFVRNVFSTYLSAEVINELTNSPAQPELGGNKRYMTIIFTDIKGFSAISEHLEPAGQVKLLNTYLTEMSNLILAQRGSVIKFTGDAMTAFFGAPVQCDDHARQACLAALRIKKIECLLNTRLVENKLISAPLLTRIGINTGDMVAGIMGSPKKMDYAVVGHAANLALRLKEINRQYGTWILISEATYMESGYDFFIRMLDRVQFAGIREPVRLYELIDEKKHVIPVIREGIEIFHEGLKEFEKRNWERAEDLFMHALKNIPGDGPSAIMCKRCQKYRQVPPPDNWLNVFSLSSR